MRDIKKEIKAIPVSEIVSRYIKLTREGREYSSCCPFHKEKTPSFRVIDDKGFWNCHGCGANGDGIAFVEKIDQLSFTDAMAAISRMFNLSSGEYQPTQRTIEPTAKRPESVQVIPAPFVDNIKHAKHGTPSQTYEYATASGDFVGYICRFDTPDGKEVLPYSYRKTGDAAPKWQWKAFDEPRPLYLLPELKPTTTVLVVEGEKCARRAAMLFPNLSVVSWAGGGKAHQKTDWTPLAGRKVAIWPDNDQAGFDTANAIAEHLSTLGASVRFVQPPRDMPKGWDVADSDLTPDNAMAWVRDKLCDKLQPYQPAPIPDDVPPPHDGEYENLIPAEYSDSHPVEYTAPVRKDKLADMPFRPVGFDKGVFYYFSKGSQQITALSPSAHTKANLLSLADLFYWKTEFNNGGKDFDVDTAANSMMRACERVGIFSTDIIRGRGAWFDAGKVAVHLGNRVILDGRQYTPSDVPSGYIYEAANSLTSDISSPLHVKQAYRFMQFVDMLPWAHPLYGKLAAGWCVVSHIGGVTHWRPHIWIIGARGSGKTWCMSHVIQPILGKNCVFVQSNSSEAGIRQTLGADSLPVLFDEAEGEDAEAQRNMQRVLALIRQSSSDTGGKIAKGTPSGKALQFKVRSCFALSSINAALVQQSDKSRVSVLELSPDHSKFEFDDILAMEAEVMTPTFIDGFYARAIAMAPVIRENAHVFAKAAAKALGEQRAGDQIGTLLAGAYSLHSDRPITYEKAVEWIEQQDWTEKRAEIQGQNDSDELFTYLLEQRIMVKLDGTNGTTNVAIGTLIDAVRGDEEIEFLSKASARKHLKKSGFKLADDNSGVFIANYHADIAKMLHNHKHSVNWHKILKRYPKAYITSDPVYFTTNLKSTCAVFIPFG